MIGIIDSHGDAHADAFAAASLVRASVRVREVRRSGSVLLSSAARATSHASRSRHVSSRAHHVVRDVAGTRVALPTRAAVWTVVGTGHWQIRRRVWRRVIRSFAFDDEEKLWRCAVAPGSSHY